MRSAKATRCFPYRSNLAELNAILDLNKSENEIVDGEREDEEPSELNRDNRDAR